MKKKIAFLMGIAVLIGWLAGTSRTAVSSGGGWVTDNQSFWRIDRVCRDGYQFTKLNVTHPHSALIQPYRFGPEVSDAWFNGSDVIDPALQPQLDVLFHAYYPQIGRQLPISYAFHINRPIDTSVGKFPSYYQGVYPFLYELPPGNNVAFGTGRIDDILPVQDCYLRALDGAIDQEIDPQLFLMPGAALRDYGFGPFGFIEQQALVYEIISVPQDGTITLDGTALQIGNQFTLAEAQTGGLLYEAVSPAVNPNIFRYQVRGTYRVSPEGSPPRLIPGASREPSISADGSRVAFTSEAVDRTAAVNDANGSSDIYLKSLTAEPRVISVDATGSSAGGGASDQPAISPDGKAVAFVSAAANLVDTGSGCDQQADGNGVADVFVWDDFFFPSPPPNAIRRLSVFNFDGQPCSEIGAGSGEPAIAHLSELKPLQALFQTPADFPPYQSDNGVSDLLLNSDFATQIFYEGIALGGPLAPDGPTYAADISADGKFVALTTEAGNLFSNDQNGVTDVGIVKLGSPAGDPVRVSITSNGDEAVGGDSANPAVSQFGTHVVFESLATNLTSLGGNGHSQIYVHDRDTGCTTLLSVGYQGLWGSGDSLNPTISADGRFVAFESTASDLIPNDTNTVSDVFVVDRDPDLDYSFYGQGGRCDPGPSRLFRVSIAGDGTQANGPSWEPNVSDSGEFVAFTSQADNLIARDTNGVDDVFVHYIGYEGNIRFDVPAYKLFLAVVVEN